MTEEELESGGAGGASSGTDGGTGEGGEVSQSVYTLKLLIMHCISELDGGIIAIFGYVVAVLVI
jgi:hypothetical protein